MIDHVSITVADLPAAERFYDAVIDTGPADQPVQTAVRVAAITLNWGDARDPQRMLVQVAKSRVSHEALTRNILADTALPLSLLMAAESIAVSLWSGLGLVIARQVSHHREEARAWLAGTQQQTDEMGLKRKNNPAFVYNLMSDGELGEGPTWEAAASAAHRQPLVPVDPEQLLVVHRHALALQHQMQTAIAEPATLAGVDLPEAKNYVGAYHQPHAVVSDVATLATVAMCGAAELQVG